ncbi:DinB family protein ['Paenibacillus yunnanensis' Narsing Rao et al. 2020]|uniref:DinB family protein n=1 Tax=Paenibacillus tengchongensis TaxID=2608684 RepID=UPI00124BD0C9|nr:DinB family protein [Paenibacillus tengchongensis]
MIHAREVLSNQFLASANDPSWYIPFLQATEGITEAQASWKPGAGMNSIAEITRHLIYWNETWQARYFKGHLDAVPSIGSNDLTFIVPAEATFAGLRAELAKVLLLWQELLAEERLDDRLEEPVGGFPGPAAWWEIVSNAAAHNAYHIGQIVVIRKLQA